MRLDQEIQEAERSGIQQRPVLRHRGPAPEGAAATTDQVAEELPVALVFNGISHAVMMVTPRDLQAFAMGFALTEGLVGKPSDVFDIEVQQHARSAEVALTIAQEDFTMPCRWRRRSPAQPPNWDSTST